MLQAIIPAIAPIILNFIKKKIQEKAPKEVSQVVEELFKDKELETEFQKELLKALSTYNDQLIRELEIKERFKNINRLSQAVRPILTFGIAGMFNVAMLIGLFTGKVSFQEYLQALGPTNSMLIGFWFGERSALKDPRKAFVED